MTAPIELWYWPTPNGWKISIALEEMGLPYEMKPVNIGTGEQFDPAFQAISPNGRMPAIVDPNGPDGQPLSIFESGAILQYLGVKSGRFYPADIRQRAEVDQWLFWQVGGLGPMAGQTHHFRQYAPAITRWEHLTRPAPSPTEPTGKGGAHRLSPAFVEWLMGLPDGWVTDVPGITRNEALKALGNGVVPQQGAEAIRRLLDIRAMAVAA